VKIFIAGLYSENLHRWLYTKQAYYKKFSVSYLLNSLY